MNQEKQRKSPERQDAEKPSSGAPRVEKPVKKPGLESDVHPQRRPGERPLPEESDNIPGDEIDPNLVRGR